MADLNSFDYFNKYGIGGSSYPMFSSDLPMNSFMTPSLGQFSPVFNYGNTPNINISDIKDVSSYVHNFFSGNDDFMSQGLKFQMQNFNFGFGLGGYSSSSNIPNYNKKYDKSEFVPIIKEKANKYGVDYNLVMAVVQQESRFNPNATSPAGAMGLMQLMPGTAKDLGVKNAYDPEQNIEGGVKYLAQLIKRYNGDTRKAVAAYNGGCGNIDKYGVDFCSETRKYHRAILG